MRDAPEGSSSSVVHCKGQIWAPSSHADLSEHSRVALLSTRMWSRGTKNVQCRTLPWGAQAQQLLGSLSLSMLTFSGLSNFCLLQPQSSFNTSSHLHVFNLTYLQANNRNVWIVCASLWCSALWDVRIGIRGQPHGDFSLLYRARRRTAVLQLSVPQWGLLVLVLLNRSLVFSWGTRKVAPIAIPAR